MPIKPVAQWTTYQDVKAVVDADLPTDYEVCRRMVEDGDHWLGGDGWIGHRTGDAVVDDTLRARIEPQFVSDDVMGELVENRTSGLIGQEADITLDPLESEEEGLPEEVSQEITTILGALAHWWDRKRLWEKVGLASDRVSWTKRGAVWPYVPDGNLDRSGESARPSLTLPTGKSLEEALDLIELDAPAPNTARRYQDPTTGRAVAIILTKIGEQNRAQVWEVNPETKQTEVRVFGEGGGTPAGIAADLGGRLPFGEMQGKRIVTPSLRRSQMLLNFAMTVAGRTLETASARERYIIDAEPELLWLTTAPSSSPVIKTHKNEAGQVVLWGVRMPRMVGAGVLNEIISLELPAKDGQGPTFKSASVQALDPVDPAFATSAADAVTTRLYKRGKQGHLGLAKTGETSGVAYQQARAQFESDLRRLKGSAEGMIRDVLEGALALAGQMSTEAKGILQRYRVVVNLRISAGPITPEESQTAVTLRDAGVISQQSAQARVGVEDPDAEQEAIDSDKLAAISKQLEMQKAAGHSSPTLDGYMLFLAAEKQGLIPPDLAAKIKAELTEKATATPVPAPEEGEDDAPPGRRAFPPKEPAVTGNGSAP